MKHQIYHSITVYSLSFLMFLSMVTSHIVWAVDTTPIAPMAIGQVVFVIGQSRLLRKGKHSAIKRGMPIYAGDVFKTAHNGYVRLKMVDDALIKLRTNSQLYIEYYQYDPNKPKNSRIKLQLQKGVLRTITGKGGEKAKDKYRLNTPVAAIGIRGTDFTVFTTNQVTRVTVAKGNIVVAGFGHLCTPSGFGPCAGDFVKNLLAAQKENILQVKKGQLSPDILHIKNDKVTTPDAINPPLKKARTAKKLTKNNTEEISINVVKEQSLDIATQAQLPTALPIELEVDNTQPPTVVDNRPAVEWGRWKEITNQDPATDINALLTNNRKIVGVNNGFAVVKKAVDNVELPSTGQYQFNLQSSESYIFDKSTQTYQPAQIENARLQIDFVEQEFNTSLDIVTEQQRIPLSTQGKVLEDGTILDDHKDLTLSVRGAVGGENASEAAYIFSKAIDPQTDALGATQWAH